jgi:ubiquinone/menaquinone biosynthesis C-methylase UbiE
MRRMDSFAYHGFDIPERLATLTGATGGDAFSVIGDHQLSLLQQLTPIEPNHNVLEIGCGIGKVAVRLGKMLAPNGHYYGVDVIHDSIEWCQNNITARHPNIEFIHVDAESAMYNPKGTSQPTETRLAIADGSIDRILLYSVFTHLFEPDIRNYLSEFRRLLKPTGAVLATWFVIDDAALAAVRSKPSPLGSFIRFPYRISMGCWVNDISAPQGAVGYAMPCIEQMVADTGFRISKFTWGYWSGSRVSECATGQDTMVLRPA